MITLSEYYILLGYLSTLPSGDERRQIQADLYMYAALGRKHPDSKQSEENLLDKLVEIRNQEVEIQPYKTFQH